MICYIKPGIYCTLFVQGGRKKQLTRWSWFNNNVTPGLFLLHPHQHLQHAKFPMDFINFFTHLPSVRWQIAALRIKKQLCSYVFNGIWSNYFLQHYWLNGIPTVHIFQRKRQAFKWFRSPPAVVMLSWKFCYKPWRWHVGPWVAVYMSSLGLTAFVASCRLSPSEGR